MVATSECARSLSDILEFKDGGRVCPGNAVTLRLNGVDALDSEERVPRSR